MGKGCPVFLGQWEGAANFLGKQDGEAIPRGHWDKTYLSRDNSGRVILLQFRSKHPMKDEGEGGRDGHH